MSKSLLTLKILTWFYMLLALLFLALAILSPEIDPVALIGIALMMFFWGYFHHVVRAKLIQEKYWAWVVSIVIFAMCIFSMLFPLGIYGMIGALGKETRQKFADSDLAKPIQA